MFSTCSFVLIILLIPTCAYNFPFRNVSLPFEARVEDLVSRLTLTELVTQMSRGGGGGDGGLVPSITRLGIGNYSWGTECIHGDASGNATSFPLSIGLAATFRCF